MTEVPTVRGDHERLARPRVNEASDGCAVVGGQLVAPVEQQPLRMGHEVADRLQALFLLDEERPAILLLGLHAHMLRRGPATEQDRGVTEDADQLDDFHSGDRYVRLGWLHNLPPRPDARAAGRMIAWRIVASLPATISRRLARVTAV